METKFSAGLSKDAAEAVIDCLRKLGLKPGDEVNIFAIGAPLVDMGFDPEAIIDGLYTLEAQKVIRLVSGNQVSLLKPL